MRLVCVALLALVLTGCDEAARMLSESFRQLRWEIGVQVQTDTDRYIRKKVEESRDTIVSGDAEGAGFYDAFTSPPPPNENPDDPDY